MEVEAPILGLFYPQIRIFGKTTRQKRAILFYIKPEVLVFGYTQIKAKKVLT